MTSMHQRLGPGFSDPVHHSQRTFRAVLEAMSRPGRVLALPALPPAPAPLPPAVAALLLTLADMDTPLWLDPLVDGPTVRAWLRFHCGCPLATRPEHATFGVLSTVGVRELPPLHAFSRGSPEYPDRSATLIIEVDALIQGQGLRLTGPGVNPDEEPARLDISGMDPLLVRTLSDENRCLFPLGLDLMLTDGHGVACLPRTVRVEA